MRFNNFSVRVIGGIELEAGYVQLEHAQVYSLALGNRQQKACNAYVEIDGKAQGAWRLQAGTTIVLEHPAHDNGLFTFYELNSKEGEQVGLDKNDPNMGLIKVTFIPEKIEPARPPTPYLVNSPRVEEDHITFGIPSFRTSAGGQSVSPSASVRSFTQGMAAGGTGLSGESYQQYGIAQKIPLDYAATVIIHLRLIAKTDAPRPLTSFISPVPPSLI